MTHGGDADFGCVIIVRPISLQWQIRVRRPQSQRKNVAIPRCESPIRVSVHTFRSDWDSRRRTVALVRYSRPATKCHAPFRPPDLPYDPEPTYSHDLRRKTSRDREIRGTTAKRPEASVVRDTSRREQRSQFGEATWCRQDARLASHTDRGCDRYARHFVGPSRRTRYEDAHGRAQASGRRCEHRREA